MAHLLVEIFLQRQADLRVTDDALTMALPPPTRR